MYTAKRHKGHLQRASRKGRYFTERRERIWGGPELS